MTLEALVQVTPLISRPPNLVPLLSRSCAPQRNHWKKALRLRSGSEARANAQNQSKLDLKRGEP